VWCVEVEGIGAVYSCFGLIEAEVMPAKAGVEIAESFRDKVAVLGGESKAHIIDYRCANSLRVTLTVTHKNVCKGGNKEERAERISLGNSFL
jgi:hypothetical protein